MDTFLSGVCGLRKLRGVFPVIEPIVSQGVAKADVPVAQDNQTTLLGNRSQCLSCPVSDYSIVRFSMEEKRI